MSNHKLSADPNALILGIVSVLFLFGGCCCGLSVIPALGMSIYGLVLANKSLKEFAAHPENFEHQSAGNVKAAKIVNVVALILSAAATLVYLAYFIFFGAALSSGIMEGVKQSQWDDEVYLEEYDDSIQDWSLEDVPLPPVLGDSIPTDTIQALED